MRRVGCLWRNRPRKQPLAEQESTGSSSLPEGASVGLIAENDCGNMVLRVARRLANPHFVVLPGRQ